MNHSFLFAPALLLILFCPQPALSAELPTDFMRRYNSSEGTVTFNHQSHADRLKDCAYCHSGLKTFGGAVNESFGHKFCLTCHQTKTNAPTECKACHKKS